MNQLEVELKTGKEYQVHNNNKNNNNNNNKIIIIIKIIIVVVIIFCNSNSNNKINNNNKIKVSAKDFFTRAQQTGIIQMCKSDATFNRYQWISVV